jgi:dTDP-glucose 4,6-dehydratase
VGVNLRYLISGGAGFIGSHLCDALLAEGHNVVAIDNLVTGAASNVAHLAGDRRFELVEADICGRPTVPEPFDVVMHLASIASPKEYLARPIETLASGSTGTRNMLEIAVRDNARFLLTSTSECYGDPEVHPQSESYWGHVNPVGLRSCYDESKRYAEALTMAYHRVHGLRTNIARIFNTYGPRMALNDGRVVPAFLDQALRGVPITVFGDGTQTRSFCYVRDLVNGLILLSRSEERYPVNLGNPNEMTILEFAQAIQRLTGTSAPIEFCDLPEDDPRRRRPDITKAQTILGWEPVVSLEEGLRETVGYFQSVIAAVA